VYGIQLTEYDKKIYDEQLKAFLPDRMIDMHVHIWRKDMFGEDTDRSFWPWLVADECTVEDLRYSYECFFPGKEVRPVLMGTPAAEPDVTNEYARDCAERHGLPVLFCTSRDMPPETIEKALKHDGFCGIKPYPNRAPSYIPVNEVRIFDFLPHEHLRVVNDFGGAVILHISRPGRLKDPLNVAQLMEIEERYPNAKIIVAHIGRAYTEGDIGNAFETLKHTKNMLFDFSANTLSAAMTACINAVGPKRLLFGSDMPVTKMRMYRITEDGIYKNVVPRGLYGDVSYDKNMKETDETDIATFMYEELLAFKKAATETGLNKKEIEDVFYNNAVKIFNM